MKRTANTKRPTFLRYMDLPAVISMLRSRQLTLLSPNKWTDRNDAEFLATYQAKRRLASLLALCFTESSETFHHWQVFASTSAGVCVRFDAHELRRWASGHPNMICRRVTYRKLDELRLHTPRLAELPFLKRHPYRAEKEVRLIWSSSRDTLAIKAFDIDLKFIRRVTLSPFLPEELAGSVKAVLKAIDGCARLPVYRSTLVLNKTWISRGHAAKV